ncbi:hypothetical protein [Phreatobacter sp.]|uniref:hypothetical protein n=1 Tax=Phreatobacter sp. TaxID=1966341 RepID=UPI0025FD2FB1|nr:hypothetical protein [Phreatobacter sp.]
MDELPVPRSCGAAQAPIWTIVAAARSRVGADGRVAWQPAGRDPPGGLRITGHPRTLHRGSNDHLLAATHTRQIAITSAFTRGIVVTNTQLVSYISAIILRLRNIHFTCGSIRIFDSAEFYRLLRTTPKLTCMRQALRPGRWIG